MDNPRSRSLRSRLADHGYLLAASGCGVGLLTVGLVNGDPVYGMAFAAAGAALIVLRELRQLHERHYARDCQMEETWLVRGFTIGYEAGKADRDRAPSFDRQEVVTHE